MNAGDEKAAQAFIGDNFAPDDRLAVVLLDKRTGSVIQRIASAAKIAEPDFQAWLRHQNALRHEVYISMNALKPSATGRTKADIAAVRHVYLDLDDNATEAVGALLKREDLPKPNYLVNSSPGKWQVLWKVEGFAPDQAEELQRHLARDTGADPAATDCSRVLRLPGFSNHKYAKPYLVRAELRSTETYRPEQFPKFPAEDRDSRMISAGNGRTRNSRPQGEHSQSERDWAYAKRALARGEPPGDVIAAIASHRRFDKHNPQYYAELTVKKAGETLRADRFRNDGGPIERQ